MNHTQRKHKIVVRRMTQEKEVKLQLGSGRMPLEDFVNPDLVPLPGTDIVADIERPLPIKDGSFDLVYSGHALEHVGNTLGLISEIHQLCDELPDS